ncbi:MAG TPA: hypothetical protein VIG34_09340 [Xanthobacteraceae bacterium]|jgi:hypothetical protein
MTQSNPPRFSLAGPALALLAFGVWAFFSVLPGLMQTGGAFRIREAWDTGAFWYFGAPLMLMIERASLNF